MQRKRSVVAASLLLVALLFSGCNGDSPAPAPTFTSSPAPALPTPTTVLSTPVPPGALPATAVPVPTETTVLGIDSGEVGGQPAPTVTPSPTAGPEPEAAELDVPAAALPSPVNVSVTGVPLPSTSSFIDTPGTSSGRAPVVSVPVTISEQIDSDSDEHWYDVDLTPYRGGALVMKLTNPATSTGAIRFRLYDPDGNASDWSDSVAPGTSTQLVQSVGSGMQTLLVTGALTGGQPYTLNVDFHPDGANDGLERAVPVGAVGTTQAFLNSENDIHWYVVDTSGFPQGGVLKADLKTPPAISGQVRLRIIQPDGWSTAATDFVDPGGTKEVQTEFTQGDKYYVVVKANNGYDWNEPYTLTTAFVPHSPYGTPGSALPITPTATLRFTLTSPGDLAYFSFPITGSTTITAIVSDPSDGGDLRVRLTDSTGQYTYASDSVQPGESSRLSYTFYRENTHLLEVSGAGDRASASPVVIQVRAERP